MKTREEIWIRAFCAIVNTIGRNNGVNIDNASTLADKVLHDFDDRFPINLENNSKNNNDTNVIL